LALSAGVELRPSSICVFGLAATWLHGREDFDFNTGNRVDLPNSLQFRLWMRYSLTDATDLSLRVENLTNERAELTSIGYPAAPRSVYLGLGRKF
jgi:outer membrane cobalamin receptor